jgi:hypothetical protein
MMKCPKCGFLPQPDHLPLAPATECPACGIVFAKFEAQATAATEDTSDTPAKTSSPVDEKSLQEARSRVNMRLRKHASVEEEKEHRNRTLQLAKQLAAEGVRRRREEWERRKSTQTAAEQQPGAQALSLAQECEADPLIDSDAISDQGVLEIVPPATAEARLCFPDAVDETDSSMVDSLSNDLINEENNVSSEMIDLAKIRPFPRSADPARRVSVTGGRHVGRARLWSIAAFLVLGVGLIGAVLSWTTIDFAKSEMTAGALSGGSTPLALLLGFAYLTSGVLGFAFFWVASTINRRFKEIRSLLQEQQWIPNQDPVD